MLGTLIDVDAELVSGITTGSTLGASVGPAAVGKGPGGFRPVGDSIPNSASFLVVRLLGSNRCSPRLWNISSFLSSMPLLSQVGERSFDAAEVGGLAEGDRWAAEGGRWPPGPSRTPLPPLCMSLRPVDRGWRPAGSPCTGSPAMGETGERLERELLGANKPSSRTGRDRDGLPRDPVSEPPRADEDGFFFFLMSLKRL